MLEVCVDSLESALNAVHGGAEELEVCSSLTEGGLTSSAGLVKEILDVVNKIGTGRVYKTCPECCSCLKLVKVKKPKVNVMIRCRTGSDFCYSEQEMDTMLADVDVFKQISVDRFVFGALTNTQDIDVVNNAKVVASAKPTPVTFHRAYDVCKDPLKAVEKIIELGFNRLLTSGQRSSAGEIEAIELITSIIASFADKIQVMPGAGVTVSNAKTFIDLGCKIVHSSCKRVRVLPKIETNLSMGTSDSECIYITDENVVRKMKDVLNS
ncbi:PF03932 family protein CutC isoform X1 [Ostrinia nubilalis]|uniref:PF03932 family protein CutC isoform X1 n=1 Tax=Ostrinia nubilalis TaxID=29057 RepID=UPI0030822DF2